MPSDEVKYIFYLLIFFSIFILSINIFLKYLRSIDSKISCSEFEKILYDCKEYEKNFKEVFLMEQCGEYLPGKYKIFYVNGECIVVK